MSTKNMIVWTPRILSILLMILMFMMSFDVFESEDVWYRILGGFLIHNIPVFILAFALTVSWKHPLVGAFIFIAAGIFYAIFILIRGGFEMISAVLSLGLPAIVIGVLFGLTHYKHYLKSE